MQVIYIDELFIINFIVNYLILLATAKVCAKRASRWRLALAAVIGSLYAVLSVLPDMDFLNNFLIMVVCAVIMVLIVYGGQQGLIRIGVIFFAISAAFGGAVFAVSLITGSPTDRITISFKVLIIAFGICYGVLSVIFARMGRLKSHGGTVKAVVTKAGKRAEFLALIDTGNSLIDPLTGAGVIISELEPLKPLLTNEIQNILEDYSAESIMEVFERLGPYGKGYSFFLVPYTAVGIGSSFLIGFRPDEVVIGGAKKKKMSVAISPTCVSDGGIYTALINGDAA